MAIGVGYLIALLGVVIESIFSEGKSKRRKNQVWGIALMLPISPAFAVGLTYAAIVNDPWSTLIIVYIFPILFITGLVMLVVGIFKKEETVQTE